MLIVAALAFTACGKKSSSSSAASDSETGTSKAIASVWVASLFQLDLTQANLTGSTFNAVVSLYGDTSGSNCTCPMTMSGSSTGGACTISTCTWNGSGSDHGCSTSGSFAGVCLNNTWTSNGTALHFPTNAFSYQ